MQQKPKKYPIIADQRGEVGRLQTVNDVDKLCTENSVDGRETAAWKYAQLKHSCDRRVLRSLCITRQQ